MRRLHPCAGSPRSPYRTVPGNRVRAVRLHWLPAAPELIYLAEKLTMEHPRSQGAGVLLLQFGRLRPFSRTCRLGGSDVLSNTNSLALDENDYPHYPHSPQTRR